jgi:hypothetical protein
MFITALRDFADGLSRGLGLFFTTRPETTLTGVAHGFPKRQD